MEFQMYYFRPKAFSQCKNCIQIKSFQCFDGVTKSSPPDTEQVSLPSPPEQFLCVTLTEFRDTAHSGSEQTLFNGAQLRLTEGVPLSKLACPLLLLLVPVKNQTFGQAEHT